ncbi:MAG: hypothetical protein ABIO29_03280 [Sphingomicrobium sp.]
MRGISTLFLASMVAGCSAVPSVAPQRTADQQAKFVRLTGNLVAGPAMSCVPSWRTQDMTQIDSRTVGFSQTSSQVTMVHLTDGCELLNSGAYAMQTRSTGLGMCTGDIVQVVDLHNGGMTVGSCAVTAIVPYSRPR